MWFPSKLHLLCFLPLLSLSWAETPTVCPPGYDTVDNYYCFLLLDSEAMTFWEAVTACDVVDGKPAEIVSLSEQNRVKNYLQTATAVNVWAGAMDFQGTWRYLSSKNQDAFKAFTAWAPAYPRMTATGDPQHCMALNLAQGWRWVNVPCSYHQPVLCEVRLRKPDPIIGRR